MLREGTHTLVTLAPTHRVRVSDQATATAQPKPARSVRTARAARKPWWQWLDFESKMLAQIWFICCTQIVVLVVGGLVLHASVASPY